MADPGTPSTSEFGHITEVLAEHRVNYHHRNVGPEPVTADNLRYTSCDGCDWLGGHRDEAGWEAHIANLLTRPEVDLTTRATYPPGDPGEFMVRCAALDHLHDDRCGQDEIGAWWQAATPARLDAQGGLMNDATTSESDEFATGLAMGVELILDSATDLTVDELVETRDNLLALFYSHLEDLRVSDVRSTPGSQIAGGADA